MSLGAVWSGADENVRAILLFFPKLRNFRKLRSKIYLEYYFGLVVKVWWKSELKSNVWRDSEF